jgi:hypothetical protein
MDLEALCKDITHDNKVMLFTTQQLNSVEAIEANDQCRRVSHDMLHQPSGIKQSTR